MSKRATSLKGPRGFARKIEEAKEAGLEPPAPKPPKTLPKNRKRLFLNDLHDFLDNYEIISKTIQVCDFVCSFSVNLLLFYNFFDNFFILSTSCKTIKFC